MTKNEDLYFQKLRPTFPEKFLSDRNLKLLISECPDEEHLLVISQYMGRLLKSHSDQKKKGQLLFELCDESHYSLKEWIMAIKVFKDYLDSQNRTTRFDSMLEYISCSCQSPENKLLKYKLHDLVNKMLNEYGYVG